MERAFDEGVEPRLAGGRWHEGLNTSEIRDGAAAELAHGREQLLMQHLDGGVTAWVRAERGGRP
jgi:hypothetical protein